MPVRIHEISKKWGIKSVDLVDRCNEIGIEASSHMSSISDDDVRILAKDIVSRPIKPGRKKAGKKDAAKKAPAKKAAAQKKAPAKKVAAKKKAAGRKKTAAAEAAVEAATEVAVEEGAGEVAAAAKTAAAAASAVAVEELTAAPEQPVTKEAVPAAAEEEAVPPAAAEGEAAATTAAASEEAHRRRKAKEEPERKAAVDEDLLKRQMAEAAEEVAKETEEESRILRRIILPPRRKPRKKRKMPARFQASRAARVIAPKKPEKVSLRSPVDLKEFSHATGIKSSVIIKKLMDMGVMAGINQVLEDETIETLGVEFGVEVTLEKSWSADDLVAKLESLPSDAEKMVPRAPVVTLLGHVDHGKTSLLDAIRHSDVASGEFGGITQHVGAYRVTTDSGHAVTFLDTPGHEAFTEMRARGANVTDIVILVVAADDGVMPQTVEAINHAKAAGVPIVVAINKTDKPESQVDRVKRQLTNYGLVPEEWGGDVIMVPVSATTGKGVDALVEMVALQAEMMELEAPVDRAAVGTVLEARRSEGKGVIATLLVQKGTLRPGDIVVAGGAYGRVRLMMDFRGREVSEASPSFPVEVSGLDEVPDAGDRFHVLENLQEARSVAVARAESRRAESRTTRQRVSMENLFETMQETGGQELRIVLKADVQGTLEVLTRTLGDLSVPEVKVNVIHSGVGSVNDSDVLLADASDAVIVGFNVVVDASARAAAERSELDIRTYNVIYRLIDEMKAALENRLAPEIREVVRGHAEVRDLFRISRIGTIAGCRVTDGVIPRRARVRVARQGAVVYEGELESLRHFKDDVREVREGFECGIKIAGFDDVKVSDIIEAFETEEVRRTLS